VTTEDDFQKALDANPADWQTRLVFADFLQERGDPRAEGYRALGVLRLRPCHLDAECFTPEHPAARTPEFLGKFWWCNADDARYERFRLPPDWYRGLKWPRSSGRKYATRRDAEDAAALAFSKLPRERRAELLAGRGTAPKAVKSRRKPGSAAGPKKKPKPRGEKP
jgi:uncharacterized protein (TIGR02996 family)